MIILLISLIIILFITISIGAILYDYDVYYSTHKVFRYASYFIMLTILIVSLIACLSISNNSYNSTSTIPIVTPILLSIH